VHQTAVLPLTSCSTENLGGGSALVTSIDRDSRPDALLILMFGYSGAAVKKASPSDVASDTHITFVTSRGDSGQPQRSSRGIIGPH
jgi:hypothetical protein